MKRITLQVFRQGPRLTFPRVNPNRHPRVARALALHHQRLVGFEISSRALGLADEPNPTYNPDTLETICLGLCHTLTELPFHAGKPWIFLNP